MFTTPVLFMETMQHKLGF